MATLPSKMPAGDLTAISTLKLNQYTVSFRVDGVAVGEYTGRYTFPIEYPSAPTKEGYIFTGWSPSLDTMPLGGGIINATFQAAEETDDPDLPGDGGGNEGGGGGNEGGGGSGDEGGGGGESEDPTVEGFYFIKASTVDDVTAAIREKTGRSDPFTAKDWAELIRSIKAGPGIKNITITEV